MRSGSSDRSALMTPRRKTKQIQLGSLKVGGDAPITVQSMTKTDTRDVQATLLQIWALEAAGCDIVRCAVPVREAAERLGEIKRQIRIPLVADIHFNYKLALIALEQGVDGLRLNPGNIGGKQFVQRSEEHTSELQSQSNLVCRLLLEKKKKNTTFTQ